MFSFTRPNTWWYKKASKSTVPHTVPPQITYCSSISALCLLQGPNLPYTVTAKNTSSLNPTSVSIETAGQTVVMTAASYGTCGQCTITSLLSVTLKTTGREENSRAEGLCRNNTEIFIYSIVLSCIVRYPDKRNRETTLCCQWMLFKGIHTWVLSLQESTKTSFSKQIEKS